MTDKRRIVLVSRERISQAILLIREHKVMLDSNLAEPISMRQEKVFLTRFVNLCN